MKVGYDITLLQQQMTGVAEYEYNLLTAMSSLCECHCYMGKYASDQATKEYLDRLKRRTAGWHAFPYGRIWKNIVLPASVRLSGIDVFHCVSGDIPQSVGRRVVYTIHDLAPFRVPHEYPEVDTEELRLTLLRAINTADQVIADSASTKTDILEFLDVDGGKVTVVPHGVSLAFMKTEGEDAAQSRLKGLIAGPYILTSGAHHRRKNFRTLLQMFVQLCDADAYDGSLVATGTLGEEDRAAVERLPLRIRKRVCITGYVTRRDLEQLYASADVFVFPNLYEGFGLPVLEAMISGCPVASSNTSSMPEVLGDAGLYFDPMDCDQMKAAVTTLLNDLELRQRFSLAGISRAKKFSWSQTAAETCKVYEKALAK